jgi:hypothetical protein
MAMQRPPAEADAPAPLLCERCVMPLLDDDSVVFASGGNYHIECWVARSAPPAHA